MQSSSTAPHSLLRLNGLRYWVTIGCTEEERACPQAVSFDITVRFARLPEGCRTDKIEDTLCYGQLSEVVKNISRSGSFSLIENLGFIIYSALKESLPAGSGLLVKVTKENPPIPELTGGASFYCGDDLCDPK